jgi:hypothetical protein
MYDDINFVNQIYLKMPPIDTTLPYLFYMNAEITKHNKNTLGETFKFVAQDIQLNTCPICFQLLDLLN